MGLSPQNEISDPRDARSEEHTSELQSPCNLVCRLLLEKKKKKTNTAIDRSSAGAVESYGSSALPNHTHPTPILLFWSSKVRSLGDQPSICALIVMHRTL